MVFTNKPALLFVWLGLLSIGAVPALINFNLTSNSLLHCITIADAKLLLFDSEIAPNIHGIKDALSTSGIRHICLVDPTDSVDLSWTECLHDADIAAQSAARPPDSLRAGAQMTDMEMLLFTSGTTGLPKAAIISFSKLGVSAHVFFKWAGITSSDRFYTCMPLYHATALCLGAACSVGARCTFILGHKFRAGTFWNEVRDSRATVIEYVGEMCRYLLSSPASERDKEHFVRMAFGNGMRPDVWNRFRERFGVGIIAELYAATGMFVETGLTSEGNGLQLNYNAGEFGAGCIGRTGLLAHLMSRNNSVVVKIDPITEEIERGAAGLCVKVYQ